MGKKYHNARQFGALPWRIGDGGMREVMLLTSRDTGRWVIPKAWPMKGRKPAEAASREAYEEASYQAYERAYEHVLESLKKARRQDHP